MAQQRANLQKKIIAFIAFCFISQIASAGIFGPLKVPFKHPFATAILVAGGYASVKAYCAAGAPATQIEDAGRTRMARIDCSTVDTRLENKLGEISEGIVSSGGVLSNIKTAIAKSNTKELRKNLNIELVDAGMPPDPEDCAAHHIVPQNETRPWAVNVAKVARTEISGCVGIDSAENGVYLPNKNDGSSQCRGSYHPTLHTKPYYRYVAEKLGEARSKGGCQAVIKELGLIKKLLISGAL